MNERRGGIRIHVETARTWAPAGSSVPVTIRLANGGPRAVLVRLELLDVERILESTTRPLRPADVSRTIRSRVRLPLVPRHGYGVRVSVEAADGTLMGEASTAIEAIEGWWESPRHAALVEYRNAASGARRARALRDWHVTVAQAYDWMWRHYRYMPPDGADPFRDALGRVVSHHALRSAISAARSVGIATMAYGSVYGAEAEFVQRFPDDRVFGAGGEPLSLGGTFFINDLRAGTHWRRTLLQEYTRAMRHFPFAGIHMDTYGPPWHAIAADGQDVAFRELYPGLIADAAQQVGSIRGGRVLFNCVEGFPLEAVAPAPMSALYLELWPPDDRYHHVVDWIDRGRGVANGRAVVIAAYAAAMRSAGSTTERARAMEATLLLTSIVIASGAYHHTLAEGDRLLVEGYYPAAVRLRARERVELQAAWRFSARYLHLLTGPGALDEIAAATMRIVDQVGAPVPTSTLPRAGAVWVRIRTTPEGRVINLVDLRAQADDRWDEPRSVSPRASGWRLTSTVGTAPVAASPWSRGGSARPLSAHPAGGWRLPSFRRWLTVVDRGPEPVPGHTTTPSMPRLRAIATTSPDRSPGVAELW